MSASGRELRESHGSQANQPEMLIFDASDVEAHSGVTRRTSERFKASPSVPEFEAFQVYQVSMAWSLVLKVLQTCFPRLSATVPTEGLIAPKSDR